MQWGLRLAQNRSLKGMLCKRNVSVGLMALLSGCWHGDAVGHVYYPPTSAEVMKVHGCDGYPLGTVRVDKATGKPAMCIPAKLGCNDTSEPGCGEGYFSTGKIRTK